MHLKSLLVSTLFYSIPVIHAATIAEVNGYNTGLARDANEYDSNVKDLKLLNDVTASKVCLTSAPDLGIFSLTKI